MDQRGEALRDGVQRAIDLAAEMAGIVGKPPVIHIEPRKKSLLGRLFSQFDRFQVGFYLLSQLSDYASVKSLKGLGSTTELVTRWIGGRIRKPKGQNARERS